MVPLQPHPFSSITPPCLSTILRVWFSSLAGQFSPHWINLFCLFVLSACACRPESLHIHTPRLCRFAVFSYKTTDGSRSQAIRARRSNRQGSKVVFLGGIRATSVFRYGQRFASARWIRRQADEPNGVCDVIRKLLKCSTNLTFAVRRHCVGSAVFCLISTLQTA